MEQRKRGKQVLEEVQVSFLGILTPNEGLRCQALLEEPQYQPCAAARARV